MTNEEIKISEGREVTIVRTGVCDITDQHEDLLIVLLCPGWVISGYNRGGVDKIPVVKVMVVVVCVAEVEIGVCECRALQFGLVISTDRVPVRLWPFLHVNPDVSTSARDHATPSRVVDEQILRCVVQPPRETDPCPVKKNVTNIWFVELICDQCQATQLGQHFAGVIRVDHAVLHIVPHVVVHIGQFPIALQELQYRRDLVLVGFTHPINVVLGVHQLPLVARSLDR
mmetsp:Transcript_58905/g.96767  ORF Transcript_58905/g.96767 Transcript_58905/m.96767 type:complete len:228 (+) Transcript_58905:3396-4079(+)